MTRRGRGGGCSTPLPVEPLPTGAISRRYSAMEETTSPAVNVNTPPRSRSSPRALYPGYHPILPAPLWRGREEAAERPGGGGGRRIPFNQRHRGQGRGTSPSPSIVPGERSSLCRQREAPTEILSPSPDTAIGPIGPPRPSSVSHRRVFKANPV